MVLVGLGRLVLHPDRQRQLGVRAQGARQRDRSGPERDERRQLRGLERLGDSLILRLDQLGQLLRIAVDLEGEFGLSHRLLGVALPDLELGQHELAVTTLRVNSSGISILTFPGMIVLPWAEASDAGPGDGSESGRHEARCS